MCDASRRWSLPELSEIHDWIHDWIYQCMVFLCLHFQCMSFVIGIAVFEWPGHPGEGPGTYVVQVVVLYIYILCIIWQDLVHVCTSFP